MPLKGNVSTNNDILRVGHFELKLNIPPNLLLFPVHPSPPLLSVSDSIFFTYLHIYPTRSPPFFFQT